MDVVLARPGPMSALDGLVCLRPRTIAVVLLALLLAQRTILLSCETITARNVATIDEASLEALLARTFCRASLRLGGLLAPPRGPLDARPSVPARAPEPEPTKMPDGDDGSLSFGALLCLHALGASRRRRIRRAASRPPTPQSRLIR